jgi:hypothetical protein
MDLSILIGQKNFIARARVPAFERLQKPSVIAMVFAISLFVGRSAVAQETPFLLGKDSRIHAVSLDHTRETATRKKMHILDNCAVAKVQATALPLVGSEGAALIPHIKSTRGVIVLEGLIPNADSKPMDTELLNVYKNYPISIPGETGMFPNPRHPLALTIAATLTGTGDLVFQRGDSITVRADSQLYTYSLPPITIPSEGILRFYLGTDDTLYYDAALKHPVHAGPCGSKKS